MDADSIHSAASHKSHVPKSHPNQQPTQPIINGTYNQQLQMNPHNNYTNLQNTNPNNYYNPSLVSTANYVYPIPPNNSGGYIPVSVLQNNGYATSNTILPPTNNTNNNNDYSQNQSGEKIQVQILPQDDNWGIETCTAITSDTGGSCDDLTNMDKIQTNGLNMHLLSSSSSQIDSNKKSILNTNSCKHNFGNCCFILLSIFGVFSPVIMVIIPQLPGIGHSWNGGNCGPACEGQLLGLACKLLVLTGGTWAVFFRQRRHFIQPRLCRFRLTILLLAILILIGFWLLFCLRLFRDSVVANKSVDFLGIVQFANSLTDSLILVHYLAIVVLEIRRLRMRFYVKLVRSPDGESKTYEVGVLTVQQVAAYVLQRYVADFSDYNVELVQCLQKRLTKRHRSNSKHSNNSNEKPKYKVYKIDSNDSKDLINNDDVNIKSTPTNNNHNNNSNNKSSNSTSGGGNSSGGGGTSARIYEETEWDKKFRKRQMRLLVAIEEAMSHVRNVDEENPPPQQQQQWLGAHETAQTLLPAVMRPLQKLLRASKRQLAFNSSTVTNILAHCLSFKLSARYMVQQLSPNLTVLDSIKLLNPSQQPINLNWTVISQTALSNSIYDGLTFQLKPNNCKIDNLSLMCTIQAVPIFNLHEQTFYPNNCRFILQTNSETSV